MRRVLLMASAALTMALAAPAVASAHHHGRHSARGARVHHRHHHARRIVFKANSTSTPGSEAPAGEIAGIIASYEGGVLKITLADGTTVSGKVSEYTDIDCGCPGHGGPPWGGDPGWQHGYPSHHAGRWGDDESSGAPTTPGTNCGISSLTAGAKVDQATLNLSSVGAFWVRVDLAQ